MKEEVNIENIIETLFYMTCMVNELSFLSGICTYNKSRDISLCSGNLCSGAVNDTNGIYSVIGLQCELQYSKD